MRQLLGLAEAARPATRPVRRRWLHRAHPQLAELFPMIVAPFDGTSRARRIAGEMTWFRRRASPPTCAITAAVSPRSAAAARTC